ncbi:hypothetical protein PUN28_008421 [Cardiocondyla obscurior]|uniref:Uncharacterized protein n=1 Tax=Cardiocondyla obscurior TaxID=286306 RepID=A0AAW2G0G6_9HYME
MATVADATIARRQSAPDNGFPNEIGAARGTSVNKRQSVTEKMKSVGIELNRGWTRRCEGRGGREGGLPNACRLQYCIALRATESRASLTLAWLPLCIPFPFLTHVCKRATRVAGDRGEGEGRRQGAQNAITPE